MQKRLEITLRIVLHNFKMLAKITILGRSLQLMLLFTALVALLFPQLLAIDQLINPIVLLLIVVANYAATLSEAATAYAMDRLDRGRGQYYRIALGVGFLNLWHALWTKLISDLYLYVVLAVVGLIAYGVQKATGSWIAFAVVTTMFCPPALFLLLRCPLLIPVSVIEGVSGNRAIIRSFHLTKGFHRKILGYGALFGGLGLGSVAAPALVLRLVPESFRYSPPGIAGILLIIGGSCLAFVVVNMLFDVFTYTIFRDSRSYELGHRQIDT